MINKIILTIVLLTSLCFSQQLRQTFGVNSTGGALTGSFTSLDSTGATSYDIYITLDDFYPFDFNPFFLVDSSGSVANGGAAAQGNADKISIGTLWYFVDADAAGDSTNIDIDVHTGVYADANRNISSAKFDATATKAADILGTGDLCTGVLIYTETGKMLPPSIIRIRLDVDPAAKEVSAGLDIYYEFVYPQIYTEQGYRKERKTF
jgi:hypothetical protein